MAITEAERGQVSAGFHSTGVRAIEEAMFKCRPALETVWDGDWVWRYARGYTGRANSLQSLNIDDVNDAQARLAVHMQRSRDFAIVPKFRLTPLAGEQIVDLLDAHGWGSSGHTHVLCRKFPDRDHNVSKPENVTAVAPGSARWQEAMAGLLGLERPNLDVYRQLLGKLPPTARGFLMYNGDGALASATLGVVADEVGAVFNLTSVAQLRRQGFGRRLMGFVQEHLRKEGAKQIALQVEARNKPAIALYRSIGYEKAYSYTYRTLETANK